MESLKDAYRSNRLILFVGAGVSANLGLPPWKQLIEEVAVQLDYDPDVFNTYGNFLALAEYYRIKKGNIGALRSWMDREWHKDIDITASEIHRLIVQGRFSAIYTTNYDRWLEYAPDPYPPREIKIPISGSTSRSPMPAIWPRRRTTSGRSSNFMGISTMTRRLCWPKQAITNGFNSRRRSISS